MKSAEEASVKRLSPEHSSSAKGQQRCSQRQNRLVCISFITLGQLQARRWTSCLFFFLAFLLKLYPEHYRVIFLTSSLLHASLKTKISSVIRYVYHLDLELEAPTKHSCGAYLAKVTRSRYICCELQSFFLCVNDDNFHQWWHHGSRSAFLLKMLP